MGQVLPGISCTSIGSSAGECASAVDGGIDESHVSRRMVFGYPLSSVKAAHFRDLGQKIPV